MTLAAYTGFRVGARNDDYRVPHLTLILYDLIILFSSNRTADEPPLALAHGGVSPAFCFFTSKILLLLPLFINFADLLNSVRADGADVRIDCNGKC